MRRHFLQLRRPGLLAVAIAMVLTALTCVFVTPTVACAENSGGFIYASYGNFYYTSAEDAIKASYDLNGATVVLQKDWSLDNVIAIPEGKKVTLDMNGYTISSSKYAVFELRKGSQLTLTTNSETKDTQFTYRGYEGANTDEHEYTVTAGGLVTTSSSGELNFPIIMYESSVLNLDGVAIAGNNAGNAGGVHMNKNTTLNMTNGATIEHNRGSGVHALEQNIQVNMDNASISGNTLYGSGQKYGGGINSGEENFSLTMTNGSKIDGNCSYAGGGIYLSKSHFEITSPDNTGVISNNSCTRSGRDSTKNEQSGGGIHVDQRQFGDNEGFIEGLTICNNYSAYDGGGIELDQEFVTIKNCTIKDNWCKYEGGGIYVCNDDNLIENCTITGNACSVDSGGNYEGGGVFVWHSYDVELKGLCVIKGNTRGKGTGNADDVFLRENAGATAKAYITGSLSKGSSVGVRSGITGDRRVAKSFKPASKDCLFYDMGGYYISYGTDEGGDAWQRHTTKEFAAKLNGQVYGKYRNGSSVTLVAPATKGGKVFWRWDDKYTTGLYPVGDYLTEETAFKNALSFSMPQNEVDLVPTYVDRVKSALFAVEAPEAGKALSTTGQLVRTDGGASGSATVPCAVYWYEVKGGEKTLAAGVAKANATYVAYVSAPESLAAGIFYDGSIAARDVTVRMVSASGETKAEATDVYVALSNSLCAYTAAYTTDGDAGQAAKTSTVEVQLKNKGLVGEGEAAVASLALDGDADVQAEDGLIGTVEVSYTYNGESDAVTISAPARDDYNFCNWDVEGDAEVSDEGTVTILVSELKKIESLTAVYTPVATSLEVGLAAPVAGKALVATCTDITASCSDGEDVSLAAGFGVGSFEVTWSPEAKGGEAAYSTAYTALIKITGEPGFEDVDKVLAKGATVTCGGVEAEAAGFAVVDGELCLAVSFPATRAVRPASVTQPEPVEVSFEDAGAGNWSLPKTVLVTLENGEVVDADVEWEPVERFDAGATAAQELTAKGAITYIAYDGELDSDGLDRSVTAAVRVAAPKADDAGKDGDADKKDDAAKDEDAAGDDAATETETETAAPTQTKAASRKGTPSTGDVTWGGLAGLLALAAACLVAARLSRRKG